MNDIMPPASTAWQMVEDTAARVFATYGYAEVRIPVVEETQLFVRSVGESTAIVEKDTKLIDFSPDAARSAGRPLRGHVHCYQYRTLA